MEPYSYTSSSSSSSTYLHKQEKKFKPPSSFQSSLHSVRKQPAKMSKKPIAPLPPTPPRVYKVEPVNFREVVQELTGAPEFQSRRLQNLAPPPLSLNSTTTNTLVSDIAVADNNSFSNQTPLSATFRELMTESLETLDTKPQPRSTLWDNNSLGLLSPLGFNLSPLSHAWCYFPLLSPGTMSILEQSTVP
ncbi:VQ motif-containing protein 29-like [Cornus florida]|uniref:VQ motif-containing protein 29-like n=1 Tax=Cornus florida TaxID=4283 RepID=UPI0028997858|nr:VQ motif-containing protein 29-like [Cornus florida]